MEFSSRPEANRIYIHAVNVHHGGGRALLLPIIDALRTDGVFLLDSRLKCDFSTASVRVVHPTVWSRLKAELWLAKSVKKDDTVLCFGNLPPLFRLSGKVAVFIQNRYLIEQISLEGFSLKVKLRILLERLWLRLLACRVKTFIVQTPSMKDSLALSRIANPSQIHILPIMANAVPYERALTKLLRNRKYQFDLLYVASGEPHKNHRALVEAWILLAQEGCFPSLCLTLDEKVFPDLIAWVEQKQKAFDLQIKNLSSLSSEEVRLLYRQTRALIYPSTFESLGLPLIEARQAGIPVIAAELDYVRDVLDPEQSFDPLSPKSITRAVKRFLAIQEQALTLHNASDFIEQIKEKMK